MCVRIYGHIVSRTEHLCHDTCDHFTFIISRFYPMSTSPGLNSKDTLCQWTQNLISNLISSPGFYLWWIVLRTYPISKKKKDESVSVWYAVYCIWCGMHSVPGFVLRQGSTRFLDRLPFHVYFVCDDLNLHPSILTKDVGGIYCLSADSFPVLSLLTLTFLHFVPTSCPTNFSI